MQLPAHRLVVLVACCLLSSMSCTTSTPTESVPVQATASHQQSVLDTLQLTIDPVALTGTLAQSDRVAAAHGSIYDLDTAAVIERPLLEVHGVRFDANGDVVVRVRHAHPLPAPDFTLPPSATNRADLGYTPRLLVLTPVPTHTFFEGEVRVDPSLVLNADAYVNPGALLAGRPASTTSYPAMLLADERRRPNYGDADDADGNYPWTRGQLAADPTGWSGFNVLHAGQFAETELVLNRARIEDLAWRVDLALLVYYVDPRGADRLESRFPAENDDPAFFRYPFPERALMHPYLAVPAWHGPLVIEAVEGDTRTLTLETLAWGDSTAFALAECDLPAVSERPFTLCAPVRSDGPIARGTFEVVFESQETLQLGQRYGLVRVPPPGSEAERLGVDPLSGLPSATLALSGVTYQVIPVEVRSDWQESSVTALSPAQIRALKPEVIGGQVLVMYATDNELRLTRRPVDNPLAPWNDTRVLDSPDHELFLTDFYADPVPPFAMSFLARVHRVPRAGGPLEAAIVEHVVAGGTDFPSGPESWTTYETWSSGDPQVIDALFESVLIPAGVLVQRPMDSNPERFASQVWVPLTPFPKALSHWGPIPIGSLPPAVAVHEGPEELHLALRDTNGGLLYAQSPSWTAHDTGWRLGSAELMTAPAVALETPSYVPVMAFLGRTPGESLSRPNVQLLEGLTLRPASADDWRHTEVPLWGEGTRVTELALVSTTTRLALAAKVVPVSPGAEAVPGLLMALIHHEEVGGPPIIRLEAPSGLNGAGARFGMLSTGSDLWVPFTPGADCSGATPGRLRLARRGF